jgi:hypothetical protein
MVFHDRCDVPQMLKGVLRGRTRSAPWKGYEEEFSDKTV